MKASRLGAATAAAALLTGCTSSDDGVQTPDLQARGTVLTTVQPTRQDLNNTISLAGKVTINPVFGLVSPADGELRFLRDLPNERVTRWTWVATVWDDGSPNKVEIPEDSIFAGKLMEDRSDVRKGMPVVSARHAGYGIVAEIDSAAAYRLNGKAKSVRAQIKNGPGPFACKPLGTTAALPEGTVPAPAPTTAPTTEPPADAPPPPPGESGPEGSEPTGMRLVCIPEGDVQLINGAEVTLQVITGSAKKALVLPVEAVAGTQGKGKVDLVDENQQRKTVDVVLGLTDGKVVQIKSGLDGDETVAVPGPNLPTAAPGDPEGSGSEPPK